jgi:hypothetical protein
VATDLDLVFIFGLGLLVALSLIVFPRLLPLRSRSKSNRSPALQYPQEALVKSEVLQPVEEKIQPVQFWDHQVVLTEVSR